MGELANLEWARPTVFCTFELGGLYCLAAKSCVNGMKLIDLKTGTRDQENWGAKRKNFRIYGKTGD